MKILLTGGAGYIGSHVSLELLDNGHQVTIIDNLVNGEKKLLHTLNGSSLALPRLMAGLIENNQVSGAIKIPKKLIPYTGFDKI